MERSADYCSSPNNDNMGFLSLSRSTRYFAARSQDSKRRMASRGLATCQIPSQRNRRHTSFALAAESPRLTVKDFSLLVGVALAGVLLALEFVDGGVHQRVGEQSRAEGSISTKARTSGFYDTVITRKDAQNVFENDGQRDRS